MVACLFSNTSVILRGWHITFADVIVGQRKYFVGSQYWAARLDAVYAPINMGANHTPGKAVVIYLGMFLTLSIMVRWPEELNLLLQ